MEYNIRKVADIISGKLKLNYPDSVISELVTDSRKLNIPLTSLFFALSTSRNDGHKFISELINKGVRNFCVTNIPVGLENSANFIVVSDTLLALQQLTSYHRGLFNIPVIGITGSNGKTIVKEWLWQLLLHEKTIIRSPQSFNSQIGVPLSVWQINHLHNLAIFEAGISEPGEMEKLQLIIKPNIGIITNIGHAHDQFFTNQDQKTAEKLKLFKETDLLIYNRDSEIITRNISLLQGKGQITVKRLFTWGYHIDSSVRIKSIERSRKNSIIEVIFDQKYYSIVIPFTDDASIENAMHCLSMMLVFGYGQEVINTRMQELHALAMRLELKEGINNCVIINDTYSSDPDSLTNALNFLVQQTSHEKKTVILSDMLQSSEDENELYFAISNLLIAKGVTRLIGIGDTISKYTTLFPMDKKFFSTTESFISEIKNIEFNNESILIKGARLFRFERINEILQQKFHETVLEIDLNALIHNLNYFRSQLNHGTKIMAMVKAFSYGSGSFEIANALQFHHVDYLAVAYADEGIELRKAGISLPIMVMNPEISAIDSIIKFNLEPEIYNFKTLSQFIKVFRSYFTSDDKVTNIHIKLDTGMHRLGFDEDEIDQLAEVIQENRFISVASAFSHLAASDRDDLAQFTLEQIAKFERMTERLSRKLGYTFMRHILNSAGIIRYKSAQFDMVRLGISLYGISSIQSVQEKLEPVSSLKTVISQIKKVKTGDSVGYNCAWTAKVDSTIAIVPVGYADGLNRKLSNGVGNMILKSQLVPIIGNINMDMTALDITGISAEEGDEVIVFGRENPIDRLAESINTIPYEILTSISRRVKRVYFQE